MVRPDRRIRGFAPALECLFDDSRPVHGLAQRLANFPSAQDGMSDVEGECVVVGAQKGVCLERRFRLDEIERFAADVVQHVDVPAHHRCPCRALRVVAEDLHAVYCRPTDLILIEGAQDHVRR